MHPPSAPGLTPPCHRPDTTTDTVIQLVASGQDAARPADDHVTGGELAGHGARSNEQTSPGKVAPASRQCVRVSAGAHRPSGSMTGGIRVANGSYFRVVDQLVVSEPGRQAMSFRVLTLRPTSRH
jgi:hypothetical protein